MLPIFKSYLSAMRFLLLASLLTFFLCACSGNSGDTPSEVVADTPAPVSDDHSREDVNGNCCFTSASEFLQFFPPDSTADFRWDRGPREIMTSCESDTLQPSTCSVSYLNAESQLIAMLLTDYCLAGEGRLDTTYVQTLRSYRDDGTVKEFNEFEVPGKYRGFTCFLPANKFAILVLAVDERFIVTLSHYRATNSSSVLKFMEYIPLNELAGFKK